LEEKYEKSKEKIVLLERELKKEKNELADKMKRLGDNKQKLASLQDALSRLEEKEKKRYKLSVSYEKDTQTLDQPLLDIASRISGKQETITRDRNSLESIEKNIIMRDDRLKRLNSLTIGGPIEENLEQSEKALKTLNDELKNLERRKKESGSWDCEQYEVDNIDFLENLNLNHQIEVKKQEINLAQRNKDFLFKLKDRNPVKVREKLLTKYGNLETERRTLNTKLAAAEEELRALSLERTKLNDELEDLKNHHKNSKNNYMEIKVQKDELVRKIDGKQRFVNNSRREINFKEAEVSKKEKDLEAFKLSMIGKEDLTTKQKELEILDLELLSIRTKLSENYLKQESFLADFEMSKLWMLEQNTKLSEYENQVESRCNSQDEKKKEILLKLEEIGKKLLEVVESERGMTKEEL